MEITHINISEALLLKPSIYDDERGSFMEAWNLKKLKEECSLDVKFVQENHSSSKKGVLRGLHYQYKKPQGKLVRVAHGNVLDVIVDLRQSSKSFGQYFSVELSNENCYQLWIPPGIAHGFLALSDTAEFIYQTTDYYDPNDEFTLLWNDQDLNIDWGLNGNSPLLSKKDLQGKFFNEGHYFD